MAGERSKVKNGVGSYRLKDGSTRYRVVYRARGKVHTRGGFTTKGAAQAFVNTAKVSVDNGSHIAPSGGRILFQDWAEEWAANVIDVRESTKARDESVLRCYVLPAFGPMQLRQIDYSAVTQWVARLAGEGGRKHGSRPLAPGTVRVESQRVV